jgi:hypothetical protein
MRCLAEGNRFGCRRALVDAARLPVALCAFDRVVDGMLERAPAALDPLFLPLREVFLSALAHLPVVAVAASFYGRIAPAHPETASEEAERMIVRGGRPWIADLVAARAMPPLLAAHPLRALQVLGGWAERSDSALRRAVAVTVNRMVRNPDCDARLLVSLLEGVLEDASPEVLRGVVRALRTLCRNHHEVGLSTLRAWADQADARFATVVRGGMAGLGLVQRRELEAVLAAR